MMVDKVLAEKAEIDDLEVSSLDISNKLTMDGEEVLLTTFRTENRVGIDGDVEVSIPDEIVLGNLMKTLIKEEVDKILEEKKCCFCARGK